MYIWGLIEVLCTVDEEDDLMLAFWNILLVVFDTLVFCEFVMLWNLIVLIKVYFK